MTKGFFFLLSLLLLGACTGMKDQDTHMKAPLQLSWEFQGNDDVQQLYRAEFVIQWKGKQPLGEDNWKLYFTQMGRGFIQESVTAGVYLEHLNGDLCRIRPGSGFHLDPGGEIRIQYEKPGWLIKEVESPSGPYLVLEGEDGPSVMAVSEFEVLPFPELEKIFSTESGIPLPDPEWIYSQNEDLSRVELSPGAGILPRPVRCEVLDGTVSLQSGIPIFYAEGLEAEAGYLSEHLSHMTGADFSAAPLNEAEAGSKEEGIMLLLDDELGPEAYALNVSNDKGIRIRGGGPAGVFYGIQSLFSLPEPDVDSEVYEELEIPCVNINDSPAFAYRGIMLDVARNYHKPEAVKRLLDVMAVFKFNILHLGLTNDEAWRLEIPSLPELTEIGARRGHTLTSLDRMIPAYGSGPYSDPDQGLGSGFLSREAFIELLKYAGERHIRVIPEINFPGHARAAIYAMETRYNRLMEEGRKEEAEAFRLLDPEDESVYNSAQNFNDNIVCVCQEAPFRFYERVVDEVLDMYREAGLELPMLHTGGDEVPAGSWTASPICREFLKDHPEAGGPAELQAWFGAQLMEMLDGKGIVMAGWEEAALLKDERGRWMPNEALLGGQVVPYVWNSLGSYLDLGNRMANAGFPVVLCNVDNFYFDLAYSHHPSEPGLYWGGFVDTRRAFCFSPYHVDRTSLTDRYRRPLDESYFMGMEKLKPEARKNILGLQGQLWSETFRDSRMLEYYYLPKMLGLAERAWAGEPEWASIAEKEERIEAMNGDWSAMASAIASGVLPRLDHLNGGYYYRIPPPGAVIRDGHLYANVALPGMEIRYTTDGSEPDRHAILYDTPVPVSGTVKLRTFTSAGRGSRTSALEVQD